MSCLLFLLQCWVQIMIEKHMFWEFVCVTQLTLLHLNLTHCGWVTHICVVILTEIGSDNGLLPGQCQASIYLYQCYNIINWTLRNKHQWHCNLNSCIFTQENATENTVRKWWPFFSKGSWVNVYYTCECTSTKLCRSISRHVEGLKVRYAFCQDLITNEDPLMHHLRRFVMLTPTFTK